MQICIAFLLVAVGGGLYALHTNICRKRENNAYQSGYMQAQKEEQMRLNAVEKYKAQLRPIVPQGVEEKRVNIFPGPFIDPIKVPESFADEMRKRGRAVMQLK